MYKKISTEIFDLDIENPLGRGTLANIELSLYLRNRTRTNTHPDGSEANAAGRSVRACIARESKREKS
jgi:hypothetical protein